MLCSLSQPSRCLSLLIGVAITLSTLPWAGASLWAQVAVGEGASSRLVVSAEAERVGARAELSGVEMGTMWTFENAPLDYWESTYGFRPSEDWLQHVRLSSVRFGDRSCDDQSPLCASLCGSSVDE